MWRPQPFAYPLVSAGFLRLSHLATLRWEASRPTPSVGSHGCASLAAGLVVAGRRRLPGGSAAAAQQATFRATVDLVAVDVQVVDRDGRPIPNLGPEKFEVTIDGRRRRVVSADFVRSVTTPTRTTRRWPARPLPDAQRRTRAVHALPGRVFMVAVDVNSFSVGDSRGVVRRRAGFVKALRPEDQVGLFAFPVGDRRSAPTTDHFAIDPQARHDRRRRDSRWRAPTTCRRPKWWTSRLRAPPTSSSLGRAGSRRRRQPRQRRGRIAGTLRRVQLRECGGTTDQTCAANIRLDAESMSYFYEGQATMALNGLMSLIRDLSVLPGRKTVVLLSAGMTASDRPGGRPNVDDLAQALGRDGRRGRTPTSTRCTSTPRPCSRTRPKSGGPIAPASRASASRRMLSRLLDMFSGASGGTMLRVLVGSGEGALDSRAPRDVVPLSARRRADRRRSRTPARAAGEGQPTRRDRPQPAVGVGAEETGALSFRLAR